MPGEINEQGLEDEQTWDWESGRHVRPLRRARPIVSVSFRPGEFQQVAEGAEHLDMPVSTFIRQAALEKARCVIEVLTWSGDNRLWLIIPNISNVGTSLLQPPQTRVDTPEAAAVTGKLS